MEGTDGEEADEVQHVKMRSMCKNRSLSAAFGIDIPTKRLLRKLCYMQSLNTRKAKLPIFLHPP